MGQPSELKPDVATVLFVYGETMLAVQNFERALATLVIILGRSRRTRELKTPEAVARALERELNRSIHGYQRASAAELRNKLPHDFDPELLPEIERMITWRDRLAHNYLLEKLVLAGGPTFFQPGTAAELMEVGIGFQVLVQTLSDRVNAAVAELPSAGAPDAFHELVRSLARPVKFGEPWKPPN